MTLTSSDDSSQIKKKFVRGKVHPQPSPPVWWISARRLRGCPHCSHTLSPGPFPSQTWRNAQECSLLSCHT